MLSRRLLLLALLTMGLQAPANAVALTRSENSAAFAGKAVTSLKPDAAPVVGLHGRRVMPPMAENSELPVFAKNGSGLRRMPAMGGPALRRLPIGPANTNGRLRFQR
jgi:hypothetical protein